MSPRRTLTTLLLAAALVACGGSEGDATAPRTTTEPTGTATEATPVPAPTPGEIDPALRDVVELAVSDLATRLDVPEDEVTVVSAEAVAWGDTSLGCPQPGMRYAQVVTDGTKTVLEHDGTIYDYHSGGERPDPFLCDQPDATDSPAPTTDHD